MVLHVYLQELTLHVVTVLQVGIDNSCRTL
jgi:hypothetical protein